MGHMGFISLFIYLFIYLHKQWILSLILKYIYFFVFIALSLDYLHLKIDYE